MLRKARTKLNFGLSDVYVFAVFARDQISRMSPLLLWYVILRFSENIPVSENVLGNFNVEARPNSFYGFPNAKNVRNNRKTMQQSIPRPQGVTPRTNWFATVMKESLWVVNVLFKTLKTYWPSFSFERH